MPTVIHPSAFISPNAHLGDDVCVGPCAVIEDDVIIGARCRIDAFASIKRYTRMGSDNHIHSYALVGGDPQDLKYAGEITWLELGDHNNVREFATLHRGTEGGGGLTKIGSHNLIMAYCHVAHDCVVGNHVVMSNNATLAGHCTVGDHAILGGLSAVHQFSRVGAHAFLGGMSGATQDLPPWMLASGTPQALVMSPNIVGLRRVKASPELMSAFKNAFRTLWLAHMPRQEALDSISTQFGTFPEITAFVDFVRASERGILPGSDRKKESGDA